MSILCTALTFALTCPNGSRPYPCFMCLRLTAAAEAQDFDAAQIACADGGGGLVPFTNGNQFETLRRYVEVLGEAGSMYWVGYKYNSSGDPVGTSDQPVDPETSAILTDLSNFGSGEPAGGGVCVAIDSNGILRNTPCTQMLPYFCANAYSGKPSLTCMQYFCRVVSPLIKTMLFLCSPVAVSVCSSHFDVQIEWAL